MNCAMRPLRLDLNRVRLKQVHDGAETMDVAKDVAMDNGGGTAVDGTCAEKRSEGRRTLGNLTPDLQPTSPPSFPKCGLFPPCTVGRYILLNQLDERPLYKCVNIDTQQEFNCKIVYNDDRHTLAAHYRVDSHEHINEIVEVLVSERHTYMFFERSYGDLHSYVRSRKRLKETEAANLFRQVVSAVHHCHDNGIVLRDLKLRKFVFKDPERTQLKLETLEDAMIINDDDDDTLDDKHGCPAYVSPEILMTNGGYSGKAADVWSMGVMLYAMLLGRYPFHDAEHNTLFNKIRGGHYSIPDTISSKAKCLIRNILRQNPNERLNAGDILEHPWFRCRASRNAEIRSQVDQLVPQAVAKARLPTGWD